MRVRALVLCVMGVVAVGCKKKPTPAGADAGVTPSPAPSASFSMAPNDTRTGIPECDAFLVKMLACTASKNLPEAEKVHYRKMFDSGRASYRHAFTGSADEKARTTKACQAGIEGGNATFATCT